MECDCGEEFCEKCRVVEPYLLDYDGAEVIDPECPTT